MLFYLEQSPPAADAFIDEVEAALSEIAESPERYPIHEFDVRVKVLGTFPYSIFYRATREDCSIYQPSIQTRRALA